jgi:S-adenosyl-L-methionine hydrolase (adenosine-forming)
MASAPSGLITLTTDFGVAEPFAGIVSGRILGRLPAARIVNLSHGIPAGRPDLAGFWLRQAWREFPLGTLHLAVVDPGVGTERRVMLAIAAGHMLLAPDNGLLPEALRDLPDVRWLAMDEGLPARLGLEALSRTFHGRDLFAPLAAELASGRLSPAAFGAPAVPLDPAPLPTPTRDANGILGRILLADRYGNLFSNIGAAEVAACRQPTVEAAGRLWPVLPTYGAAPRGELLALVNAFGLLELAINGGNAGAALALAEGAPVRLRDGLAT